MLLFRLMKLLRIVSILVLVTFTFSCKKKKEQLNIAVSSNARFAIEEIVSEFENTHGIQVNIIASSSGKIAAQIEQGAPFDIFFSADFKYPQYLLDKGIGKAPVLEYAQGRLVIWTTQLNQISSLVDLDFSLIDKIACPNPETAPYGRAAMQYLKSVGLENELKDKLIYGESISQSSQYILNGSADLGFTSLSFVLSPKMKSIGKWNEIKPYLYDPIRQGFIVLNENKNTILFKDFMFTEKSEKILKEFGYFNPK